MTNSCAVQHAEFYLELEALREKLFDERMIRVNQDKTLKTLMALYTKQNVQLEHYKSKLNDLNARLAKMDHNLDLVLKSRTLEQ